MSQTLLVVEFPFSGPWGTDLSEACQPLAQDIAAENGLRWKLWTENPKQGQAGGIYLFDNPELAKAYMAKHAERLKGFGVSEVRATYWNPNQELSHITYGPLG